MLTFQAAEIEAAKLKPGEEPELKQERDRLANAEALAQHAQEALAVLDEGSAEAAAATDLVGQAARSLAGLTKIDSAQQELADQAATLEDTLADLVRSLRSYLDEIEYNPKRRDIEERLNLIHGLTPVRRHPSGIGVGTTPGEHIRRR
jgi:DNA repair protein RecN (Recombination protein N)